MEKLIKNLKVYKQSSADYTKVPAIVLKGEWLKKYGFDCDEKIEVLCENDVLIIKKKTNL